jgi:hypothetical protein
MKKIAALVPVTSRGLGLHSRSDVCGSRMECLARSLARAGRGFEVLCFLGIDGEDPVYDENEDGNSLNEIRGILEDSTGVQVHVLRKEMRKER